MNSLPDMLWIEVRKAARSKLPLFTLLGFLMLPLTAAFFMVLLRDPEVAQKAGFMGPKAQLAGGSADWPTYFSILGQGAGVGGFIVFSFIGSWVFGREFSDHTVKDMLAVPVPRFAMLLAKFIVLALWGAGLIVVDYAVAMVLGMALNLPLATPAVLMQGSLTMAVTGALVILVVMPVAFFASAGRGYLPAIGATFVLVALANIIAVIGWGMYFPWSVPGLYAGAGGQDMGIGPISFALVALTGLAGVAGTVRWWQTADQHK
jgi:ABC-2 type transport system permease protein